MSDDESTVGPAPTTRHQLPILTHRKQVADWCRTIQYRSTLMEITAKQAALHIEGAALKDILSSGINLDTASLEKLLESVQKILFGQKSKPEQLARLIDRFTKVRNERVYVVFSSLTPLLDDYFAGDESEAA